MLNAGLSPYRPGRTRPEEVAVCSPRANRPAVLSSVERTESILFPEGALSPTELAREMEAARQRRSEKTARLLREARVQSLRTGVRPGSTRAEIEERARSFYPKLSPELLQEAIDLACALQRPGRPEDVSG